MTYKTVKAIVTIGPASESSQTLKKMIRDGIRIFRLNLSHGDFNWHKDVINRIEDIGRSINEKIVIVLDLPGPKFRIGKLPNGNLNVEEGRNYTIGVNGDIPVSESILSSLSANKNIKLSDGKLELKPIKRERGYIITKALNSYSLLSEQSINQDGISYPHIYPTKDDIEGIKFGLKNNLNTFALSFISSSKDVEKVRKIAGKDSILISKIERKEGVNNFKEIAKASDIVMVARGDLGLNMDISNVPKLQEKLILEAHQLKKPVIVATQMLESMVNNSIPTRAEADDVFTAVEEGADSLMLSEETAIGNYPLKSVKTLMHLIDTFKSEAIRKSSYTIRSEDDSVAEVAVKLAESTGIKNMIIRTVDGASAFRLSRYFDSGIRLFALTPRLSTFEKLAFGRGIEPFLYKNLDYGLMEIKKYLKNKLKAKKVILVAGVFGKAGSTTKIEILDL
ncbi:MAG: pyruvate kinase [Candidatus Parvarchaeota archaeon]|nr:pyruvate kinase [Candidatus Parvarchaeota archaeon]MCW1301541.1 pyruvate kinase [Candidatus Parvarchaeota archaeon]